MTGVPTLPQALLVCSTSAAEAALLAEGWIARRTCSWTGSSAHYAPFEPQRVDREVREGC